MRLRSMMLAPVGLICLRLSAQTRLLQEPPKPALLLGAAWYPAQWHESRWDGDLTLMGKGEFDCSRLEPRKGNYSLDWLERAIRAAERHHIAAVLDTLGLRRRPG